MALATMIKKLTEARKAYDDQLKALGKGVAKEIATYLAENIPPGYALKWTQGTPSFNDGEPCTFSVRDPALVKLTPAGGNDEDEDQDEGEGMDLGTALERYGMPDEQVSYERQDYSKPISGKPGKYETSTKYYTKSGFPKIDGYTKTALKALDDAWGELPEDMLKKAFGDGAKVVIQANGKHSVDEYYCE